MQEKLRVASIGGGSGIKPGPGSSGPLCPLGAGTVFAASPARGSRKLELGVGAGSSVEGFCYGEACSLTMRLKASARSYIYGKE